MRKKITLLVILPVLLSFAFSNLKAQVYNGNLTLTSQAEVDAFNYTSVTGDLTIYDGLDGNIYDITNLDGLSELTSVGGNLYNNDPLLENMDGLNNLISVGGNLDLINGTVDKIGLNNLTSIGGYLNISGAADKIEINNLTTIGKSLSISFFHSTDISGLNGVTSIGEGIHIGNTSLVNISGLNGITALGFGITIDRNLNLANISGFNGLTSLKTYNGQFNIMEINPALTHIDGFNGVKSIYGDLEFQDTKLVDIHGFSNLNSIIGHLSINLNEFLNDLSGLSNLDTVYSEVGIVFNYALPDIQLNGLKYASGLTIQDNNALVDISGLNNLSTLVPNGLVIFGNPHLTNISGLNGLISIEPYSSFSIGGNDALAHIDGFNGLASIGNGLNITQWPALNDIHGFNTLTSIEGGLFIQANNQLKDFSGLSNLSSVGEQIIIHANLALVNIDGLNGLTSVGKALSITDNPLLLKIDGLNNLVSTGGDLEIEDNNSLAVVSGLNNLTSIGERLQIDENSSLLDVSGLNNLSTIVSGILDMSLNSALTNISGLNDLTTVDKLFIGGNSSLTHIDGFKSITSITGDLEMIELPLIDINGFTNLTSIGGNLSIEKDYSLNNITGLSKLTSIGGQLRIILNTSLPNIDVLSNLSSVGGNLYILDNYDLISINGLSSLTSVGGLFSIQDCISLVDLNALIKLTSVGGNLFVQDNTNLSNFCGLYPLLYNNGLAGSYNVSGNAVNPTKQEIITAGGTPPVLANITASSVILAPPNHKMKDITVDYTATAACGPVTTVLSVSSNEPINGTGDGDTSPDWIIVDDHHVKLRAERAANGNGRIYTITITATNLVGITSTKTVEVRVAHNITDPQSGKAFIVGSTVNFSGEFWDKPTNKHSAKWLIDDNTSVKGIVTEPTANKNGKVTGSYKFTAAGVYKLQMNTTDQNNIVSYANTNGDLEEIIVVYDPNGGYTYGGGYYNSPAGALKTNPTATGKASYGFAMNYFKNSSNPKGETQFEFKVGDFEFNALNFDYLVISNSMAQFKGTGKIIGGQSGVGFTMTVSDGQLDGSGIDKIRMKIYNKNNGAIIYDNQFGASDAALPTQAVGANSTVVISGANSSLTSANTDQNAELETKTPEVSSDLDVIAFPNPSANNFTMNVNAKTNERITMQIVDMYGRIVETRNVNANSLTRFGDRYNPGTYFVKVIQGKQHKEIKLIKLSD